MEIRNQIDRGVTIISETNSEDEEEEEKVSQSCRGTRGPLGMPIP